MEEELKRKNLGVLWILFIIYPLIAFLNAVRFPNVKQYRIFMYAFALFYSYTFIPIEGSDATRYEQRITEVGDYPFNVYWSDILSMYDSDVLYNDAYVYTVFFVLSKFSDSIVLYRVVFAGIYYLVLLALVYGIYDYVRENQKYKPTFWYLLGIVFLLNLSAGLNGVRFPLALQLFLLGFFKYITTDKLKNLLLCFLAFFVHFMIGYVLVFLLLFILTKKYYKPYYALFVCLLFFGISSAGLVKSNSSILGEGIAQRTETYTESSDYQEERNEHLNTVNWYIKFDRYSTYNYGLLAIILLVCYRKKIFKDNLANQLEYFVILMYIASIVSAQLVDEISNRYYIFANASFLILMYYLSSINYNNIVVRRLTYIFIPIGILHILIMIRGDQETFSPYLIIGNIFTQYYVR